MNYHLLHPVQNFGTFHPFCSIPLNSSRYSDFGQYIKQIIIFFPKPIFFIYFTLFFEKLLLLHLHMAFYYYFPSKMCFSCLLYSHMTWLFSSLIFFIWQVIYLYYVMMILSRYVIWFWINNLIWYNIMWWKLRCTYTKRDDKAFFSGLMS